MGLPTKIKLHFGDDVTAIVKLQTAVDKEGTGLKMACATDEAGKAHAPASVKMPAVCTECGKKGSHYSFPRAREVDGRLVMVTPEELAAARGEPTKEIVVTAHPLNEVLANTFPGEAQYLMIPSNAESVEAYSMIRQALADNPDVALVAEFAVTSANKLWRVGIFEDGLCLSELAWPEDVKARPAIPRVTIIDELRKYADEWMNVATTTFDPLQYRNEAKARREELIAAKVGTAAPVQAVSDGALPGNVSTSLLERLKKNVEAAKASLAAPAPAKKTAAKKTTTKKAAAKKTAAVKQTA